MIDLQFDSKICEKNAAATRTAFKAYGEDPSDLKNTIIRASKSENDFESSHPYPSNL